MSHTTLPDAIPILLVDDRPGNLLSLEALLGDNGYDLVRATSGNEALHLTLKQDFALVLLDVQMPEMDGFETAELMHANPKTRHIPIIFVTAGMKDLQFQFKGYDCGAVDFLTKPIEPLLLQSKVRIFAELYRQRTEIELHKRNLEEIVVQRTAKIQSSAEELKASNEQLTFSNKELKATEELLRAQVTEFVETRDQLLATEEMLRVQIEEYQVTQKLLNESNASLKTLFDVAPLAIVVSTLPGGIIQEINHAFSKDFGFTRDTAIGKTGIEIGLWDDNDERDHFLKQTHEQQGISGFSAELKTITGEIRSVLLYKSIMDYMNKKCLLIVFFDVTEQKRMEEQIRQTQKMDVIGQLAGGVAHDFNNMLTAILGSSELLERHVADNPAAIKLLGSIQQAASRSADLTGQLLSFSRKGQKNVVQVHIDTMIHDAVSLLERTIGKQITLRKRLAARNNYVNGDPALIQNALLNLGVNARDAMSGEGTITFTTANVVLDSSHCRSSAFSILPGPYIEISVSDTGCGMTKELIQRIFEPFFTTKGVGKGTGLGLAAVYSTITDHHGCISIISEPGIGSIFKLYLPLAPEKKNTVSATKELIRGSGGILLVDDEEIIRDVGKTLLEELGYRVYLAEDGQQALEVYARERDNISLIILDMLMPRMGGKETLLRLMEKYPDVRILISSGFHQGGTVDELKRIGAIGFLQKPYIYQELCTVVADSLREI
ncbi:MAG: response regulator [Desulfuromonadaceae bacterium]|nr:response regulator [Desulfuromonadaceae bacterium]